MKLSVLRAATPSGLLADSINDAASTRKVYLLAVLLAVLGIALIVVTIWFWRSSRHDPELLAPLETMGTRRFRALDESSQRALLDTVRPAGAEPMQWGLHRGQLADEPEVDLGAIAHATVDYEDLREPLAQLVATADAEAETPAPRAEVGESESDVAEAVAVEADLTEAELAEADDLESEAAEAAVGEAAAEPIDTPMPAVAERRPARPLFESEQKPFVVKPLDHDLPLRRDEHLPARTGLRSAEPDDVDDHDISHDDTLTTPRGAIDPLLRRFEGSD